MPNVSSGQPDSPGGAADRGQRRLQAAVKESMRELSVQLSLLNAQVSAHLKLKEADIDCLDVITRYEPISPSALARRTGLHPATLTGILDRLERGGFISRERNSADRRAVLIRARRERGAEIYRLYGGMNGAMDGILGRYAEAELEVLADFLRRTAQAGQAATVALAAD
jgi:DNA-binding MarR family transcriptional regulator